MVDAHPVIMAALRRLLRLLAVFLALVLQLLLLFLPILDGFARRVRSSDPELHALAVRAQGWLLRRVLPAPRFRASLVEPRLYVGSLEDTHARPRELDERRVRSVLTVAGEPSGLQPAPLPSEDFSVLKIDIGGSREDLARGLRHALPFLHDALGRKGGRSVLVHSCGGNGRACAVAAAFLMQARGMPLAAALAQLRAARPAALTSPTAAAIWIPGLQEYEAELRQRGLLLGGSPSPRPATAAVPAVPT